MTGFAELLLQDGLISELELARAQHVAARSGRRLPATIVKLGLVAESELADALAKCTATDRLLPSALCETLDHREFNAAYLNANLVLPLSWENDQLSLAVADPTDEDAQRAMMFAAGATQIRPMVATFSEIEEALASTSGPASEDAFAEWSGDGSAEDLERMLEEGSEAPVIRLVQRLLTQAVIRKASDVHIEPMTRHVSVRYRIDGRLSEIERLPDHLAPPIASRIKVMSGLDIAEARLPQDGRLKLTVRGRDVDVRVSTSPTAHGESVVMRLLGQSELPLDLNKLGLPDAALAKLLRALDRPHGIILLTGPTGSGKTTTLYAAVNRLRRPDVKILTVEDPVEVLLEGVNQVQVRPEIDLSYAATLRAFLRQDPDILMIGEIRDHETADIAMRAALTGHLVLSTLHTNSALGAFTRLADIGVEPYLTASTVIATIAQRLLRVLCAACKTERKSSRTDRELFERCGMAPPAKLWDAGGCANCGGTGYSGRTPLIEVVEVDDLLRERIRAGEASEQRSVLPAPESLFGHGLALAATGRTSLSEVQRVAELA